MVKHHFSPFKTNKKPTLSLYIRSLGCTIIELCTGKPPYADLLTMTAMFKIVEDDAPPLPEAISDASLF